MKKILITRSFSIVSCIVLSAALIVSFQNCSKVGFNSNPGQTQSSSTGTPVLLTGQITSAATKPNPPLDLFFIIDNSASMLGHQIDLGNAFANIFSANSQNLSAFDTKIYIFSTASTVNSNYLSSIPNVDPSSLSAVPSMSNMSALALVPGSIFGFWANVQGAYPSSTFSYQFNPAAVLDNATAGGSPLPYLLLPKQGSQTADQYQSQTAAITAAFKSRLQYLNPVNELSYEPLTDVSSGLCSIARIMKHSSNFIQSGDSAAFVIVSDDNDRLNDRNPNSNQCIETFSGNTTVVDGTCGHYETTYKYDTNANVVYQTDTKVTYQSGTNIAFSYQSGTESCGIQYSTGYKYTWTYTAVQTKVTYTKCNQVADGTCVSESPGATAIVAGAYANSDQSCNQDMTSLVSSPAPGTGFTCVSANAIGNVGAAGVDAASNGSACSSQLLAQLQSHSNVTDVQCAIGAMVLANTTIANQASNSCASFCSANSAKYPSCALIKTTPTVVNSTISFAQNGLTCASQCLSPSLCGTGTIGAWLSSKYSSAICGASSAAISTLVVNAAVDSNGKPLTLNSSLSGLTVHNSSNNQVICPQATTINNCILSLQSGTPTQSSALSGGDQSTITANLNVGCSTNCSAANGLCGTQTTGTVASYLAASKNALCLSSTDAGVKTLSLQMTSSAASSSNCSTLCSATVQGSCDGKGFGAANGATVADYITSLGGANCSSNVALVNDGGAITAPAANPLSSCPAQSTQFSASNQPHEQSILTTYVAGDSKHLASDFQNYISSQAINIFGANNIPSISVIGHLTTDKNLYGTDPSTDYFNLANLMGSSQILSVEGNYATALSDISSFIVKSAQNSFVLNVPTGSTVVSVSILQSGSNVWQPIQASDWNWVGQTLSLSPSLSLAIGDEIQYQYY